MSWLKHTDGIGVKKKKKKINFIKSRNVESAMIISRRSGSETNRLDRHIFPRRSRFE